MHIVKIPESLDLGPQGQYPAGEYLVQDHNGAQMMIMNPGATLRPFERSAPLDSFAESILLVAPIGFGDAILLSPCLRAIKALHPNAMVTIATLLEYRQAYLGLPYVDGFEDYPVPIGCLPNYDTILFLERALDHAKAKTQHMTDRFAEHLGLGELTDKTAEYHVSQAERDWVFASFPRTDKKRVGVQIQAGARCRSYPRISLMVEALRRAKYEVYLIGKPGEFRADGPPTADVVDLSRRGLTWRQSVAFLLTCDVVLAPDSSMLHAAGVLNVPAVGLFGPYPWKLRTAYYKSVLAIQGIEGCNIAPCFHVDHLGKPPMPLNGPCAATGRCAVLESIPPKRILAKIEQLAAAASRGLHAQSLPDLPEPSGTAPAAPVSASDKTETPAPSAP